MIGLYEEGWMGIWFMAHAFSLVLFLLRVWDTAWFLYFLVRADVAIAYYSV
jgi:hypothetical protein